MVRVRCKSNEAQKGKKYIDSQVIDLLVNKEYTLGEIKNATILFGELGGDNDGTKRCKH